jgi:hypothetical protein
MVETPEIITLALGAISLFFVGINRLQIKKVPFFALFILSYLIMISSWLITVLEDFFWSDFLNALEHAGYLLSSIILSIWCWKVAFQNKS